MHMHGGTKQARNILNYNICNELKGLVELALDQLRVIVKFWWENQFQNFISEIWIKILGKTRAVDSELLAAS